MKRVEKNSADLDQPVGVALDLDEVKEELKAQAAMTAVQQLGQTLLKRAQRVASGHGRIIV
jgi:hypothetical protein